MVETIFITGGTGYIGSRLIRALQKDPNYLIKALVRKGSEHKLPGGCELIYGDALNSETYQQLISPATTFVHLIGVPHPSPSKKALFKSIDGLSINEAAKAASFAGIKHFVYLSVSQYPSKIMKEYQDVRATGERTVFETGIKSSIMSPWYVLGPGHWWPILLLPFYGLFSLIPSTRQRAREQGLVTIDQMIKSLVDAIQNPPLTQTMTYTVPDIRKVVRETESREVRKPRE
jgi:uncharacterized protein YbjT (DUF2867 family)